MAESYPLTIGKACTGAAFATVGITHVMDRQMLTAGEASAFWQPWVDMIGSHSPHL